MPCSMQVLGFLLFELISSAVSSGFLVELDHSTVSISAGSVVVNPRRACAAKVTVLGLCVCVSVTQHLIFHVIIRTTNDTNLFSSE